MDDVGKRRLLELADFLDGVPPERFNMDIWADDEFRAGVCGTAACAAGWATTIPSFRDAGFRLERDEVPYPVFREYAGLTALRLFFRIDYYAVERLFHGRTGDTPKSVASDIRSFVENLTPQ